MSSPATVSVGCWMKKIVELSSSVVMIGGSVTPSASATVPISCARTSGETVTPGTNAGSMLIVSPLSLTIVTLFVRSRSRIRSVIFPTSPGASWIVALVASGLLGSVRPAVRRDEHRIQDVGDQHELRPELRDRS